MGWDYADDHERYQAARRLSSRRGRLWMVMWAPALRAYVGFYLGPEAVPWQSAPTSEGLSERLEQVERELAAASATRAPEGFWSCPNPGCLWSSINPMPHPCPVRVPPARDPAESVGGHGRSLS
ncbi:MULTISPECIES: hypothetical protein [Nocardiopsis]|uniref:Uncharacterized protein n=1 Tax=Nocardiopsis sinuspersici TaxID=501010 RepID=A0A1V3C5D5_9ACTN|nr:MULTISPECIES: hypothetical protein [Nocardiopsis]NYH52515.1 hypothetical protein [Nocardiopsis sinuspersici]OOC55991.1 hypothetical protein NOSIN_20900 [Nocardiopsis sinuspersici]